MKRGNTISQLPPGRYLWPDGRARLTPPPEAPADAVEAPLPKGRGQWAPYRNKTEWRFAEKLAIQWLPHVIQYEKIKLAIGTVGGKTAWYCPDFVLTITNAPWQIYEVKGAGPWRRHGIERLRCAALAWPQWEWYLVEWVRGEWSIKRVEG